MKKKIYIQPQIEVMKFQMNCLLQGVSDDNYDVYEDEVEAGNAL